MEGLQQQGRQGQVAHLQYVDGEEGNHTTGSIPGFSKTMIIIKSSDEISKILICCRI